MRPPVLRPSREVGSLLLGRGVALGALPAVMAARYGHRPALEDDAPTPGLHPGGLRTFVDVETATARLAAAHRAAGVAVGTAVLVVVENRLDVLLHAFALTRLGACPVPVNARLRPAELASIARATGAAVACADGGMVGALRDAGLTVHATGDDRTSPSTAGWLAEHLDTRVQAPHDGDPDRVALMLATSGTTGAPKAAALTSRGLLAGLGRLAVAPVGWEWGPRAGRDLAVAALPLTHVMGFSVALAALTSGVPLLHRPRFRSREVLDLLEARRANVFVGVPTMYADLEEAGAAARDLRSVQLWVSAADVMPAARARRFQTYGATGRIGHRHVGTATFVDVYGMVELSGAAAVRVFPPSPLRPLRLPAVARVLPGVEVRAVDEAGDPVGHGRVGELRVRSPGVLREYAGESDSGPDEAGWFATGDYGRVWPGGLLQFAGRQRDRLKVGGFSVFPAEVEETLRGHPDVADVAVVGVPDTRLGERPVALLVPAGADLDTGAWLDWARERVAGYRRPTDARAVEALPRGPHGKLDRAAATRRAQGLLDEETR